MQKFDEVLIHEFKKGHSAVETHKLPCGSIKNRYSDDYCVSKCGKFVSLKIKVETERLLEESVKNISSSIENESRKKRLEKIFNFRFDSGLVVIADFFDSLENRVNELQRRLTDEKLNSRIVNYRFLQKYKRENYDVLIIPNSHLLTTLQLLDMIEFAVVKSAVLVLFTDSYLYCSVSGLSINEIDLLSTIKTKIEYTKTQSKICSDIHNNDFSGRYDNLSIINFKSSLDAYKKISSHYLGKFFLLITDTKEFTTSFFDSFGPENCFYFDIASYEVFKIHRVGTKTIFAASLTRKVKKKSVKISFARFMQLERRVTFSYFEAVRILKNSEVDFDTIVINSPGSDDYTVNHLYTLSALALGKMVLFSTVGDMSNLISRRYKKNVTIDKQFLF